jgi:hypothetical protein
LLPTFGFPIRSFELLSSKAISTECGLLIFTLLPVVVFENPVSHPEHTKDVILGADFTGINGTHSNNQTSFENTSEERVFPVIAKFTLPNLDN